METLNAFADLANSLNRAMAAIDNDTRVMTCGEAAYLLNKSPQTISRYIAEGKLHKASANGVNGVWAKEVYKLIWK